jgi:hypothetical protein
MLVMAQELPKPRKPSATVDRAEAFVQLVQMAFVFKRGKKMIAPLTLDAINLFTFLLGIEKHHTGEKSAEFPHGKRYWEFPHDVAVHLERLGIDPSTLVCTDWSKLALAIREFDQAKEARYAKEHAELDFEARSAAVNEVLQTYRRTKPPKTATPSQVLESYHLNNRIAKEIIKAQEDLPPSSWQEKIALAPDDSRPGKYGMPIPDEDPPASAAKPKVDQTKPYWWRERP